MREEQYCLRGLAGQTREEGKQRHGVPVQNSLIKPVTPSIYITTNIHIKTIYRLSFGMLCVATVRTSTPTSTQRPTHSCSFQLRVQKRYGPQTVAMT